MSFLQIEVRHRRQWNAGKLKPQVEHQQVITREHEEHAQQGAEHEHEELRYMFMLLQPAVRLKRYDKCTEVEDVLFKCQQLAGAEHITKKRSRADIKKAGHQVKEEEYIDNRQRGFNFPLLC